MDYFIQYFENWRQSVDITDFYMIGHSFGGFTSSHYTCKYHQHVKKLLLCSPCGIRVPKPEQLAEGYDPQPDI